MPMRTDIKKISVLLLLSMALTACGAPDTLESLMSSDAAKKEISDTRDAILLQNTDIYSDHNVKVSGNDIVYKYYFTDGLSDETLEDIENELKTGTDWSSSIENVKDEIEHTSSIRPSSVTFAYFSADGRELFNVCE